MDWPCLRTKVLLNQHKGRRFNRSVRDVVIGVLMGKEIKNVRGRRAEKKLVIVLEIMSPQTGPVGHDADGGQDCQAGEAAQRPP